MQRSNFESGPRVAYLPFESRRVEADEFCFGVNSKVILVFMEVRTGMTGMLAYVILPHDVAIYIPPPRT